MEAELHKLRIDKNHRAARERRSIWPIVLIVLLLLLIGGGAGALGWWNRKPSFVVQTVHPKVSEVRQGASDGGSDLVALTATGYVNAAHKIELASKVVGKVAWVGVEMGDKIKKDQVLVRLEDDEYKARVAEQQGLLDNAKAKLAELMAGSRPQEIAQTQAMLDKAKAELASGQLNLDRVKSLEGTNSVSKQQIDDADGIVQSRKAVVDSEQQQVDLAKLGPRKEQIDAQAATVRQLEGSLSLAMVDLQDTVIRAPFDATVLNRNVEVGEFVTTGFVGDLGAKGYVLSIANLNDLRVELDISQNQIAKAAPGQPCWITTDAYPDHKYSGVVELISPEANRQKATVLVRVTVLKPDELIKPDMNATVSFLSQVQTSSSQPSSTSSRTVRVPSTAMRDGGLFVVEDGKARRKAVTVGLSNSNGEIEIQSGLVGGEDVIVNPPDQIKDGDNVKVEESKN